MQSAQVEASEEVLEQMLKLADKDKNQMVGLQELQDLLGSLAGGEMWTNPPHHEQDKLPDYFFD